MVTLIKKYHKGPVYPLERTCSALLEQACATLANIIGSGESHRLCSAAGGVEVLVELLKRHVVDGPSLLITRACQALRSIACCGPAGGVEALVELVKRYRDGPVELTQEACRALCNMMLSSADNPVACSKVGGVEALVDVLTHHDPHDCVKLVQMACCALLSAMQTLDNKVTCGVVNGGEVLVQIIKSYQSLPPKVIEAACDTLWRFVNSMTQHQHAFGEIGGVEALISVIQHYSTVESPVVGILLRNACGALHRAMDNNNANTARCIHAGAIPTLVDLFRRYVVTSQHATDVLTQACTALQTITMFSSKHYSPGTVSAVEMLIELVKEWRADVPKVVINFICATITSVVVSSIDGQTKFVACGGVEAFVNLVNYFVANMTDVSIMHICNVLTVVANNVDSKTKFRAAGGISKDVLGFLDSKRMFESLNVFNNLMVVMYDQPNQKKDTEVSNTKPFNISNNSTNTATTKLASTPATTTATTATKATTATTATSTTEASSTTATPATTPATATSVCVLASTTDQLQVQQNVCNALLKQMEEVAVTNQASQTMLRSALLKQIESIAAAHQEMQHALQVQIQQLEAQVESQSAVIEEMKSNAQVAEAKVAQILLAVQSCASSAACA